MSRAHRANIIESSTIHNLLAYARKHVYMRRCVFNNFQWQGRPTTRLSVAWLCLARHSIEWMKNKIRSDTTKDCTHSHFVNHFMMNTNTKTKQTKYHHPCRTPARRARRTKKFPEIVAEVLQPWIESVN